MSLEKRFQEKLREHRIEPTAKPWERIEAELNKNKKRSTFVIYSRWAAAASVALLITAYASWNRLPIGSNINQAVAKTDIQNNEIKNKPIEHQIIVNQNNETSQNFDYQIITKETKKNNFAFEKSLFNENKKQENINIVKEDNITSKRNIENNVAFLENRESALTINKETIALNLPEIPNELQEKVRLHKKWNNLLNEEINEESDSTLTERAFVFADQKTRSFVQRSWKPILVEFFKLRRGF